MVCPNRLTVFALVSLARLNGGIVVFKLSDLNVQLHSLVQSRLRSIQLTLAYSLRCLDLQTVSVEQQMSYVAPFTPVD